MALSIGKAWDEARAAIAANRRLITPVALGLILVPAVVSAMIEPRVAPGTEPEAETDHAPIVRSTGGHLSPGPASAVAARC